MAGFKDCQGILDNSSKWNEMAICSQMNASVFTPAMQKPEVSTGKHGVHAPVFFVP